MTIKEALQAHSVRLCFANRFLIFGGGKWVVMEIKEGLEVAPIFRTEDEEEAVKVLLEKKRTEGEKSVIEHFLN